MRRAIAIVSPPKMTPGAAASTLPKTSASTRNVSPPPTWSDRPIVPDPLNVSMISMESAVATGATKMARARPASVRPLEICRSVIDSFQRVSPKSVAEWMRSPSDGGPALGSAKQFHRLTVDRDLYRASLSAARPVTNSGTSSITSRSSAAPPTSGLAQLSPRLPSRRLSSRRARGRAGRRSASGSRLPRNARRSNRCRPAGLAPGRRPCGSSPRWSRC